MPAGGLESRMRARSRASLAERAWRAEGKMPLPDNVIQHFLFRCRQVAEGVFRHFVLGFDTLLCRTSPGGPEQSLKSPSKEREQSR